MAIRGYEVKSAREQKVVSFADVGVKFAEGEGEEGMFSGYGAVFGNIDSYGDVILKGAFKDSLREAKRSGMWPAMLLQHGGWSSEDMTPIGVWTDLEEDEKGLKVEGKLALNTSRGRDVYELMRMKPRPALSGLSIGYRVKEFEYGTKPTQPRRTLKKVHLLEISPVTFPANPKAGISAVKGAEMTERQLEQVLMRDAGFSAQEAKAMIAGGFKALKGTRDAAPGEVDVVNVLKEAGKLFRS
ncbi:HK97 family phage prohead protease [Oceanibaculum indicum]|uniref:Prohead serine protease domain-containing protein n=1 Tax=Oceanibaculum indicum TaxID=526216 RepID=A0A420WGK5_9PROT|nr:HK97 family phage prohead protease [Oceanibaculum indicum]RKQ70130.1 hypothetical protein BCL74_2070 [Oceanibaculum indicum]